MRKNNNVINGTTGGQADSIRKLQRKKSIDANKSASINGDKKSTIQKWTAKLNVKFVSKYK